MDRTSLKTIDAVAATPSPWKYGSLALVDTIATASKVVNYLVRGPLPVNGDGSHYVFDDEGLCEAIEARICQSGLPLQKPYYIRDVSLLHPDESGQLAAERDFFATHPARGDFTHWDTYGTDRCFFDVIDPAERDRLALSLDTWLSEPLIHRVETIRSWLTETPPEGSTANVVYVHCDGGCDRTGEIIGAYLLRFLGMTWQEMYASNQACARPFGCDNYRAVQWYARYLELTYGVAIPGVGEDGGCFDGATPNQQRDAGGNLDIFSTPIIHGCRPPV